jgi:hypothetical protein
MIRRRLANLLVLAPLALPVPALAHIRLTGAFTMAGRITVAHAVPGERAGQSVARMWTFMAPCPAGQCRNETLVRARAIGADTVMLRRPSGVFSRWVGTGSFYGPLSCGSRVYPRGERVWFTIKVRITATAVVNGQTVATTVSASYASDRRTNRTPCVAALGRDAAVYTGTLIMPAPVPPAPTPAPG